MESVMYHLLAPAYLLRYTNTEPSVCMLVLVRVSHAPDSGPLERKTVQVRVCVCIYDRQQMNETLQYEYHNNFTTLLDPQFDIFQENDSSNTAD